MKYNDIMDDESLSSVLRGLDDSVTVPPSAASEWRTGVQKRMRFDKRLNKIRWAGEIAAVILIIVCVIASPFGSLLTANPDSEQRQNREMTGFFFFLFWVPPFVFHLWISVVKEQTQQCNPLHTRANRFPFATVLSSPLASALTAIARRKPKLKFKKK